jgi:hypothetical protein
MRGDRMIIDYDNLSDDHETAFIQIVDQLDAQLELILSRQKGNGESHTHLLEYINSTLAAASALGIDDFTHWSVPSYDETWETYSTFSLAVKNFIIRIKISKTRLTKIYSVLLEQNAKTKIHHYIAQIRNIIENSDLTDRKRNSLFSKLNAFSADVDRSRTRFDNAMLFLIDVADVAKRGTESLKPLTDLVKAVTELMGEAKASEPEPPSLPKPVEQKQIEGPKTEIVEQNPNSARSFNIDDEIPF